MNDSEHELHERATDPGDASSAEPGVVGPGLEDLASAAGDRIRQFMAESTVSGGASPADVANLYTASEIVDDDDATAYLDRRFVHGEVLSDWRAFQDRLSAAYLDSQTGTSAEGLLASIQRDDRRREAGRSIFDDPDEDELVDEDQTTRIDGRLPSLGDLSESSRQTIERHIISEVLCYGVAPFKVMEMRDGLQAESDERALQYLDLPFEQGERPNDWGQLRDRALMVRARLEGLGIDPTRAFIRVDAGHPEAGAWELLGLLDQYVERR